MKYIKRAEVAEVRDYTVESLLGVKGASTVASLIKQAAKTKNIKVVCTGEQGAGKTLLLKTILNEIGYFEESEVCDEVITAKDFEYALSDKCKYFTAGYKNESDLISFIDATSDRELDCIIIKCAIDLNGKRYVEKVIRLRKTDKDIYTDEIVIIHKGRYKITGDV